MPTRRETTCKYTQIDRLKTRHSTHIWAAYLLIYRSNFYFSPFLFQFPISKRTQQEKKQQVNVVAKPVQFRL